MATAIIFDTESTGKVEPVLIEAAYLSLTHPLSVMEGAPETESFIERFNPGKPIELGALAVHHILDEELADKRSASEFAIPEGTQYLIGHNVDYDWQVLGSPQVKRICTLALARDLWPGLDSYSQPALIYYFHRGQAKELLKNAHNALADVRLCNLILIEILKVMNVSVFTEWQHVWERSEKARIPKIITFGKHQGTAIVDLPRDYRSWMLTKAADFDPYLIQAIRSSMA